MPIYMGIFEKPNVLEPIAKLHRRAELSIFWGVICDVSAKLELCR